MSTFDFAIVGSDQFSALLAGVLAADHHKKVLLVQDRAAPYRLPREFHLSFQLATRPENFSFFQAQMNEGHRLITRVGGRQVLTNASPRIVAHTQPGSEALAHLMQMGRYFGLEMDRIEGGAPTTHSAYRIRGVQWVRPRQLWATLTRWVTASGVSLADARTANVIAHRDGSARVDTDIAGFEASQLALTDGRALMRHGNKGDLAASFTKRWGSALLTEPQDMRDSVVLQPEIGFCAWRQANGTLGLVALTPADRVGELTRANLSCSKPLRRAGQSEFELMVPKDNSPVLGKLARSNVLVASGFNQAGLHLLPAIARHLVGKGSPAECTYFEHLQPSPNRQNVTEIGLLNETQVAGG